MQRTDATDDPASAAGGRTDTDTRGGGEAFRFFLSVWLRSCTLLSLPGVLVRALALGKCLADALQQAGVLVEAGRCASFL